MSSKGKMIIAFIIGMTITSVTAYSAASIIAAKRVTYNNDQSNLEADNVQDAIDELYDYSVDYSNINTRLTDLEGSFAKHKIEFFPGTTANNGGYIDFHFNNSSSDYTSRIIEGSNGSLNLVAPNGVKINGTDIASGYSKKPVNVYVYNSFTSSTSFAYTGTSVTIPANSFYALTFKVVYNHAKPTEIGVSTSSSTYSEVASNKVGHHHASVSYQGKTGTSATSFYVWATYPSANQNNVSITGFYIPE